ncbi:protein CBFA2T1-like isoform X3 [Acanthaster planci]|uniref:Protein CBFA2T1-like isoform X3 n=1 Tax=Acanthaster planci TaxID=133434 RepID=A0A8B7ZUG6_ACAPL|nr:protein CBFA2T1-like isoform X3 [Acanthaster planci]
MHDKLIHSEAMKKNTSPAGINGISPNEVKIKTERAASPKSTPPCSGTGSGGAAVDTEIAEQKPITLSKLMHARAQRNDYYQGTGVFSFELHHRSNSAERALDPLNKDHSDSRTPESPVEQTSMNKLATQTSPGAVAMATHPRSLSTNSASGSLVNGMHSPHSVNSTPSPPSSVTGMTPTGQELPPACGARQLSKLKRFLTTLQQFGSDISPEIGERVRNLVMGLVNNALTVEDFHHKLQEATNFPLRPFVIPFLKANLSLLQRELMHCARLAKMTPSQYYMQHEQQILDGKTMPAEGEAVTDINENGKRRTPDDRVMGRPKENGADHMTEVPLPKRHCSVSPGSIHLTTPPQAPNHYPAAAMPHHQIRMEDLAHAREMREMARERYERERDRHPGYSFPAREHVYPDQMFLDDRIEDDWKHVDTMLQCIVGMVEKTKRALAVLHQRSIQDREELSLWARRHTESTEQDLKKRAEDMIPHGLRPNDERIAEVKRRAGLSRNSQRLEEAVNEVKRQAVAELQKAVAAAEQKANEMVNAERAKLDQAVVDARRQAADNVVSMLNHQEDSSESCWNCGRKANETCSGCNTARYCGSFCQHKDWETHHRVCGQYAAQTATSGRTETIATTVGAKPAASIAASSAAASPAGSSHSNVSAAGSPPAAVAVTTEAAR